MAIPTSLISAGVFAEIDGSAANTMNASVKPLLLFGHKNANATAPANELSDALFSEDQATDLYGEGSQVWRMFRAARAENEIIPIRCMAIAEPSGARAAGSVAVAVTGTAGAGTITLYLGANGSDTLGRAQIAVTAGDSAATIAAAIRDAVNTYGAELSSGSPTVGLWYQITARDSVTFTTAGAAANTVGTVFECTNAGITLSATDKLKPVTTDFLVFAEILAGATSTVNLHCRFKGILGNKLVKLAANHGGTVSGEFMPSGVALTWTQLASGSGTPDLSTAISALGDFDVAAIVNPFSDVTSIDAVSAEITRRDGYAVKKYCEGFHALSGNYAAQSTLADSLNEKEACLISRRDNITPVDEILAAHTAAALSVWLPSTPQLPVHSKSVSWEIDPGNSARWTFAEGEALHLIGCSPGAFDASGNAMCGMMLSTMITDANGAPTNAYREVGRSRYTPAAVAAYKANMLWAAFSQSAFVSDTTRIAPGQLAVSPSMIRSKVIQLHGDCVEFGWCQDSATYIQNVVVTADSTTPGRVIITDPDIMAGPLNQIYLTLQFRLTV